MNGSEYQTDQEETTNMDQTTMGGRIAARRRAAGLTQQELADRIGVTNKAVSKWETNEGCPDIKTVPALCQALEMSADELLTGAAPAPAQPKGFWDSHCWLILGAAVGGILGIIAYNHGWL